ncbi:hypothetical protein IQ254_03110 [Nodosilinea sp. LEGE 07088]|uniref:hypothetical protein n=1 Tax=Nodosilinea sp. LEGE 07088 TaxID=2777968 RepID=UPI0018802A2F|nr:hypothetical protein [Nodosilinea sp. LEGE 07088]MBE9136199.1 hypothetical protein [Nodosilinea sp. LEGE 07088]
MKATLIRLFIWPSSVAILVGMSVLSLLLLHWPGLDGDRQVKGQRDEFPGQRRGGGTHWANGPQNDTMV